MQLRKLLNPIKLCVTSLAVSVVICSSQPDLTLACPDIEGIVDMNCDQKLVIVAFGDSITSGERDTEKLGYPGRLRRLLPMAQVYNLGDEGETTEAGRNRAQTAISLVNSPDYTIILEGVNDYWNPDRSVERSRNNLYSIMESSRRSGAYPLLGSVLPTYRYGAQTSWVKSLNSAISSHVSIDFYSINRNYLSIDALHPSNEGYELMAHMALESLVAKASFVRPADSDYDGIYDFAEPRFGVSSQNSDSDGDGLLDGAELFELRTNPLVTDSDGDGFLDGFEVSIMKSNPGDARPSAPFINSIQVLLTQ